MPSENQECFLSGIKLLFKQAEGVPPVIKDLNDLTEQLANKMVEDRNRIHYRRNKPIEDLLAARETTAIKVTRK
ncbi:hypothetical protein ABH966_004945 [Lysinibacillus sp. RC46]|uniref:hypothetical protein n=1 Tax=unclassified Lysinibacillus TaxID=2636778 RepID=UPI00351256BB